MDVVSCRLVFHLVKKKKDDSVLYFASSQYLNLGFYTCKIIVQIYSICFILSRFIDIIFQAFAFTDLKLHSKIHKCPLPWKKTGSQSPTTRHSLQPVKVCLIRVLIRALITPILGSNDEWHEQLISLWPVVLGFLDNGEIGGRKLLVSLQTKGSGCPLTTLFFFDFFNFFLECFSNFWEEVSVCHLWAWIMYSFK